MNTVRTHNLRVWLQNIEKHLSNADGVQLYQHFDRLSRPITLKASRVKRITFRQKKIVTDTNKFWKLMAKEINALKLPFLEEIKFV